MATKIPIVVLDPGHGGTQKLGGSSSNNATGPNGLLEKNLTLDLAQRVARSLAGRAQVILTRADDTNLSLADRAAVARTNSALLFLSIHLNGWPSAQVDGTEVYVARAASDVSRGFAQRVLSRLLAVTQVSNRGVKGQDFGVLLPARHAKGTAVCLAEVAFLTNPAQARRLEGEEYRQAIAGALVDAVSQYLPEEHYLHQDAARPDRRIPPPVTLGLATLPHAYWVGAQSYTGAPAGALDSRIRFVLGDSVGRGGKNKGDDIGALKERLVELGLNWLKPDRSVDADTIDAINLIQSVVGGHADERVTGDGLVSVPGQTYRWLQASNAPRWQLMPAGSPAEGFDNVELTDTGDNHDFGTKWMADSLKAAAAHYRDNFLNTHPKSTLMTINDVSLPRGGDTPDHHGHERGMACDLRLPRTDGTAPGATKFNHPKYDQAAARAMLQALRAQPLHSHIFFNDPVLVGEGLCHKPSPTDHVHDDHIHFAIKPPEQGGVELIDVRPGADAAGLASFSSWESPAARVLQNGSPPACGNNASITAGEIYDDCKLLVNHPTLSHGKVTPNLFLRWNFIPAGACQMDIVVHFHGYALGVPKPAEMNVGEIVPISGLDFVNRATPDAAPVRQGRPTLCILPLGRNAPVAGRPDRFDFPFFTSGNNPGGLQQVIDYSLGLLAKRYGVTFSQRRLILTAHSGGGAAVASVLDHRVSSTDPRRRYTVHQVHLFDAVYGQEKTFADWALERMKADEDANLSAGQMPARGGALRVLYLPCSAGVWSFDKEKGQCVKHGETETHSRNIQLALDRIPAPPFLRDWYRVEQVSGIQHMNIPAAFGSQLLGRAGAGLEPAQAVSIPTSPPACCKGWPKDCAAPSTCRGMPASPAGAGAGR
ncbi:MAG: N-acetylmuramoyl-L-alanine amidase [Pyrinomonadaceae bacterium]